MIFHRYCYLHRLVSDKNEEAKLEEWRNTAKRELEEWYARQAEQVEKHKKNNRLERLEIVTATDIVVWIGCMVLYLYGSGIV